MATNAAYIGFTRALAQMFDSAKIEYEVDDSTETGIVENVKWVNFQFKADGHKLYVPKNKTTLGACQTTIDFPKDVAGVLELEDGYKNGAIRSHLSSSDPERVAKLVIAALRSGAPVPQKRAAQPRQQGQGAQRQGDDPQRAQSEQDHEDWALTEDDIGQVQQEILGAH